MNVAMAAMGAAIAVAVPVMLALGAMFDHVAFGVF
jgi:hypothetical protein